MIIVDYNDKRPIYEQIVEKLSMLILRGVYGADEKLPSVRSLAIELSINPNTIQRAYGELERQGYIYSVKGRGNFVKDIEHLANRKREKALEGMCSILKECKEIGIAVEDISKLVDKIYAPGELSDGKEAAHD